jgi:organic hydroperoxide reductase OsmC/OhrA
VRVTWSGNRGTGTSGYAAYGRDHAIEADGKPPIAGSSDPAFRGDAGKWNPEELFVASIAACHELWYLHLCADAGVVVTAYVDRAEGALSLDAAGGGRFTSVVLHPEVTVADPSMTAAAMRLHAAAHAKCFIANSLSVPVTHEATIRTP